ncbi:MAG: hypothetical protein JWQ30_4, partial [Sediminibacterium sp.]|nr:hypothetical protein [Sediminibacterium sp.]
YNKTGIVNLYTSTVNSADRAMIRYLKISVP